MNADEALRLAESMSSADGASFALAAELMGVDEEAFVDDLAFGDAPSAPLPQRRKRRKA